jgi:hypothetical protein
LPTTYLVHHGQKLTRILQKNGRELEIFVPPGHPFLVSCLEVCKVLLCRDFHRLRAITFDSLNATPTSRSAYLQDLENFGFTDSHRGLVLRR